MGMTAERVNLFGLDRVRLRKFFVALGEKPFRADQLMQWVYGHGVDRFEAMTNIAKRLREHLAQIAEVRVPALVTGQTSSDGTRKWLLRVDSGNSVEAVFIPEAGRGTLCISSQVGCAMDCSFCSTGKQGFNRNLSAAEIIGQVWFASRALAAEPAPREITNVVFMGMGEPLANFEAVVTAINILLDPFGYGLSKRRVTVSTAGLVPFIDRLRERCDAALAVSLHAPTNALRNELVPINRKYPLEQLMAACRRYVQGRDRRVHVTFEYVMLAGVNDQTTHARSLVRLIGDLPAKVNLIPFNSFADAGYQRSSPAAIAAFQDVLVRGGLLTTVRRTRGDDIDAACGQLVGRVQDRQRRRLGDIPVRSVNA